MRNLRKPFSVAIDSQGYLLVGNNGRNNIEIYGPANGDLLASFGEGMVRMPTSITSRASVLKVSPNIIGKNWISIKDGSGNPPDDKPVVTTSELVEICDTVTA